MKTMKNSLLMLGLCALTVSCAALGKYKKVDTVQDNLYGNAPTDTAASIAQIKWQEFFNDQKLITLIDTALARNNDLKGAYEHIVQADAQLTAAKLAYVPSLNLPLTASYYNYNGGFGYNLPASASWQLNVFSMANSIKSAKATKEQAEDYRQAVQAQLIASVANCYYTLMMLDEELATSNSILKTWEQSVEMVIAMKEAGLADQVAVSQYEANRDNIQITVINLENQIDEAENTMCLLLSCESGREIPRNNIFEQKIPDTFALGVPAQLLTLRPDVRAAEKDLELAFYTTKGAILNYFPKLTINGAAGFGTAGSVTAGLLTSASAALTVPIFNYGKNRAAVKAAESRQREVKGNFDQTLLNAGVEVNNALNKYHSCDDMATYYASRVNSLDSARIDTEYLMKNSLDKTYLDVLYAYTTFFDAKLSLISNQAKKMQATVELYTALGGGAI